MLLEKSIECSQAWWFIPVIPALGGWGRRINGSRPAGEWDPVSKKEKKKTQNVQYHILRTLIWRVSIGSPFVMGDWKCEWLASLLKALGSIPSTEKKEKKRRAYWGKGYMRIQYYLLSNTEHCWAPVAHACSPIYLGGWVQRISPS
jgi:hypothetical protein